MICDRFPDCSDGTDEDETVCATCPFKFLCTNGRCKDLEDVCDGRNNCEDNSDEDQICVGELLKFEHPLSARPDDERRDV